MTTKSKSEQMGGMSVFNAARKMGVKFSKEVSPEEKYVQTNGMRFHYLDWGNHGKPKMLLLHGGAQSAHMWDFFCLSMSTDYHIVAPDQRGHGDSEWSMDGSYSPRHHAEDMNALTDAIGFDKFIIAGLSMGGRNSYGFAARYPSKVRAMVITDVGPDLQAEGRKRIAEFMEGTIEFESYEWLVERVVKYNNNLRSVDQVRGSLINNLKQLPDGRWTWKHDRRRGVRRDAGSEFTDNAWEEVAAVQCPTLIVRGADSDIFSMTTAKKMQGVMKNSSIVEVPKAGHLVPGDNPVGYEKVFRTFLKSLKM